MIAYLGNKKSLEYALKDISLEEISLQPVENVSNLNLQLYNALLIPSEHTNLQGALQQVNKSDQSISVLVLGEAGTLETIKQKLLFTPYIGKTVRVVDLTKPKENIKTEIEQAINRTKKRRNYNKLQHSPSVSAIKIPEQVRHAFLNQFIDFAPTGAILINNEWKIVYANQRAHTLLNENTIEGKHILTVLGEDGDLKDFIQDKVYNQPKYVYKVIENELKYFEVRVSSVLHDDKTNGYRLVVVNDFTEQKTYEESLKAKEETLRLAVSSTGVGYWDMNIGTQKMFWSERARELLGIDGDWVISFESFIQAVHPEDRTRVKQEIYDVMRIGSHGKFESEFKIQTLDSVHWLKGKGQCFFNETGKPVRFLGTLIDVTESVKEREEMEEDIIKKDEFIGVASHELKTPLTSAKAYIQLLERHIEDEKLKGYVDKASYQITKLTGLVSDLLDVSKINTGKLQFNYEQFEFKQLIKDSVQAAKYQYPEYNIKVIGDFDHKVKGDRMRLEQVLDNFISNAVKYSPGQTEIKIIVSRQDNELVTSVQDYGIGIEKEKQKRIFERFYRAEESSTRFQGLGIGLYISAEIIKRHNGRVWLTSEPGKGSIFSFAIPIKV